MFLLVITRQNFFTISRFFCIAQQKIFIMYMCNSCKASVQYFSSHCYIRSFELLLQGLRAQIDRGQYKAKMQQIMLNIKNLNILEGTAEDLLLSENDVLTPSIYGIRTGYLLCFKK